MYMPNKVLGAKSISAITIENEPDNPSSFDSIVGINNATVKQNMLTKNVRIARFRLVNRISFGKTL